MDTVQNTYYRDRDKHILFNLLVRKLVTVTEGVSTHHMDRFHGIVFIF